MAAISSHHLLFMSFCLYFSVLSIHAPRVTSLSFSFNFSSSGDPCGTELTCEHDAHKGSGVIELTKNEIRGDTYSFGRASYARPVPLWDKVTGELASFTSTFTFQIKPKNETTFGACDVSGDGMTFSGDGMAFFLAHFPSRIPPNSYGGNLALFNDSNNLNATGDDRVVAVEFDTFRNYQWDHRDNHVGIDVNSIYSSAYTNVTENLASNDSVMTAVISYNNRTGILVAHLQINDSEPYNVSAPVDMKASLPEEVAVGFSAATGFCIELHQVLSWSFSSTLEGAAIPANATTGVRLVPVLVPAAVAFFLFLCTVVGCLVRRRLITDGDSDEEQEQAEFERGVGPRRYRFRELAAATSNFAEDQKLGRGGFGNVYRGSLSDQDRPVAVKMFLGESSEQGRKAFEAEVKIISRLRHRNLVQLLGWCDSRKGLLLVYELVAEGSLDRHLYSSLLTWSERYNIILGLGSALHYLHEEWEQCVVHGDIKPSNIMLDSLRNAKLGDFGLARLIDHGTGPRTTHVVMGTAGYIDPEFVNTRKQSKESDIYSFGIVLLELVSGRHPVEEQPDDQFFVLLKWVRKLHGNNTILEAADEKLRGDDELEERQMERVLVVGLWCAHPDGSERPSISQAMHVLSSGDAPLPALPPQIYNNAANVAISQGAYSTFPTDNSCSVYITTARSCGSSTTTLPGDS